MGATDPCLYGCIAGIGAAAVVTISISIFHNAHYGWESLGAIRLTDDAGNGKDVVCEHPSYDPERLRNAAYVARGITLFLFLALFVIWPLTCVIPFSYNKFLPVKILTRGAVYMARHTYSPRNFLRDG